MAMFCPRGWPWFYPGWVVSGEGFDFFSGGGLGESDRFAGRDDYVGVVEEAVDESGCEGAGHEFVEPEGCRFEESAMDRFS